MRKLLSGLFFMGLLSIAFLAVQFTANAQTGGKIRGGWETVEQQLSREYEGRLVKAGSELEKLIRANQDFSLLRADEQNDLIGLPSWLRVNWRKNHPEGEYRADDPTGGYPRVLHEVLEWMMTHQDLKPGAGEENEFEDVYGIETVGANVRVSGAQTVARSESDIRINYFDTQKILSASNNIGGNGLQGVYFSTDGGTTWGQTFLPLATGDAFHSDPTVEWTNDGRAYSSTLGINSAGSVLRLQNYYSTNNGASWTFDATASGTVQASVDKQMVWVDHNANSPFFGRTYAIWHNGSPAIMNRRTPGATGTWLTTPITVSTGDGASGTRIGSDVKTNSAGDVFGFYPATTNRGLYVVKSTNGGEAFSTATLIATSFDGYDTGIPAFNNRRALIYLSGGAYKTATKNLVYASWTDLSGDAGCTAAGNEPGSNVASTCKMRVWFSRSLNGGTTWSTPVKVNNQSGLNDQFNQWMVVDETNGRIGIIYYDTVADSGRKKADVYFQFSADDGVTFSAPEKVTTAPTDETISGADSGNQYGDYNGLSGLAGSFFPSWTDRRNLGREEVWTAKITSQNVAASVSIGGRVFANSQRSLAKAFVYLTNNATGEVRFALSNSNGYYNFNEVATGATYTVSIRDKRYRFNPQTITPTGNLTDLNFFPTASFNRQSKKWVEIKQ